MLHATLYVSPTVQICLFFIVCHINWNIIKIQEETIYFKCTFMTPGIDIYPLNYNHNKKNRYKSFPNIL